MPANQSEESALMDKLIVNCYISPHIHILEIITQHCNTLAPVYCSRSSFKVHTDKRYLPVTCHDHNILLIICFVGLLIHGLVAYKSNVRNVMPG